jgi:hypothetical protein
MIVILLKYYPNGVLPSKLQYSNFTLQANILQKNIFNLPCTNFLIKIALANDGFFA